MNTVTRYLLIGIVSASLVAPAQAFDLRLWFYAFSERTRTAMCLGAATVVAGVGLLGYKLWCKKKVQPKEEENTAIVQPEPVRSPSPSEQLEARQRLLLENGATKVTTSEPVTQTHAPISSAPLVPRVVVQAQQGESKRSAQKKQIPKVSKSQPKKVEAQRSLVDMYNDFAVDTERVTWEKSFAQMKSSCNQVLEKVKKAIQDGEREDANKYQAELVSLFEVECKKVYPKLQELLAPVKEKMARKELLGDMLEARRYALKPYETTIAHMGDYYKKYLRQEIEEIKEQR